MPETILAAAFGQTVRHHQELMDTMIRHAIAGLSQDTRAVRAVANGATAELVQDPDQTIATSTEVSRNPEITERAVRISVLAMAIAMEMGWDEELIREVGECGLVHDWGMFRLSEEIRGQRSPLSDHHRELMTQHPLYTFEMLEKMRELPDSVRMASAQVHEKLDGTGYPHQLEDAQIHPYAKILHVADAYVSLTEETWGRPAYIAYDVMVYLLSQAQNTQHFPRRRAGTIERRCAVSDWQPRATQRRLGGPCDPPRCWCVHRACRATSRSGSPFADRCEPLFHCRSFGVGAHGFRAAPPSCAARTAARWQR
ncbi:MAG: HD domain-containing protein [Brachymonas sp.]|nr:HD domain-containing protein [Brachymonas sp.]